jgi:hypothetical protein
MGLHTEPARTSADIKNEKLWDPVQVLGITNTDRGYQCITCIGYAPSQRRRCRNEIRADNRKFITTTLKEISYMQPDSPLVAKKLKKIVGPALCVRYHQNQAEDISLQWKEAIKGLKPQTGGRTCDNPTRSRGSIPDKNINEQLREARKLMAEMRELYGRQPPQDHEDEKNDRRSEERERLKRARDRVEKEKQRKEAEDEQRKKEQKARDEDEQKKRDQRQREQKAREAAQKLREQRERKERESAEKAKKEREEWDQAWQRYEERWVSFKAGQCETASIKDSVPWPVKSGLYKDVKASSVREFLKMAVPRDADRSKMMRLECKKWHPDSRHHWVQGKQLAGADLMMVEMICRQATDMLNEARKQS